MNYEFDCGCGLSARIRLSTLILNPRLREKFAEGWHSVFYSPSKARKCRTCGKKATHGFVKAKEA